MIRIGTVVKIVVLRGVAVLVVAALRWLRVRFWGFWCWFEGGFRWPLSRVIPTYSRRGGGWVVVVTSEEFAAVRRGFADYRLEEVIGEGAFGVVVSATQIRMDRRVAVKSLRSDHAHQAEVRRRFAIEAQVLGRFQHPHIVDVYDYREGDDFCALVMERLEGGSLRQRLGGWPLRPDTACAVALAVCSALEYAHGHDVLHRDIKPANLLFGRYGGIEALKLTDFGIAKVVSAADQPTQTGSFLGTASYMAPEQIEGRDPGPGVDIYGTAILLYQMLSDRLPFSTEGSAFAVAQRHLSVGADAAQPGRARRAGVAGGGGDARARP